MNSRWDWRENQNGAFPHRFVCQARRIRRSPRAPSQDHDKLHNPRSPCPAPSSIGNEPSSQIGEIPPRGILRNGRCRRTRRRLPVLPTWTSKAGRPPPAGFGRGRGGTMRQPPRRRQAQRASATCISSMYSKRAKVFYFRSSVPRAAGVAGLRTPRSGATSIRHDATKSRGPTTRCQRASGFVCPVAFQSTIYPLGGTLSIPRVHPASPIGKPHAGCRERSRGSSSGLSVPKRLQSA